LLCQRPDPFTTNSSESKYLGAAVPTVPDLANQAKPITDISKDTLAFLIQKGDQDCTIPVENTKMLADALTAAGLDVQYDLLKNVGHGDGFGSTTPVFESDSNNQILINFLEYQNGRSALVTTNLLATPAAALPTSLY
jgi:acetyl esterase/lipase